MRILLVEDDTLLGDGVCAGLHREDNAVDWVKNGEPALSAITNTQYDCIILDISLPKMSGLEVLQRVREAHNHTPVLILTSQDDISDRVNDLDAGADDYLVKPFEFAELCARLRALSRRNRGAASETIKYEDITIDTTAHTVEYKQQAVALSRREFTLLVELISNRGRVLSRHNLEQKLYSWGDEIESNTIEETALLSPLAINKNIDVCFNETLHIPIVGNESALRLLIRNLLTNAISYTPANGNINIQLTQTTQQTTLIFEDSGQGISQQDRERVMERFYRAENHQAPGCGIGLSIVDRVMQMHRGSLQLCQADSGQGLKVVIQF